MRCSVPSSMGSVHIAPQGGKYSPVLLTAAITAAPETTAERVRGNPANPVKIRRQKTPAQEAINISSTAVLYLHLSLDSGKDIST